MWANGFLFRDPQASVMCSRQALFIQSPSCLCEVSMAQLCIAYLTSRGTPLNGGQGPEKMRCVLGRGRIWSNRARTRWLFFKFPPGTINLTSVATWGRSTGFFPFPLPDFSLQLLMLLSTLTFQSLWDDKPFQFSRTSFFSPMSSIYPLPSNCGWTVATAENLPSHRVIEWGTCSSLALLPTPTTQPTAGQPTDTWVWPSTNIRPQLIGELTADTYARPSGIRWVQFRPEEMPSTTVSYCKLHKTLSFWG